MNNLQKVISISLLSASVLSLSACSAETIELSDKAYLSDFETSIAGGEERTVYKIEELMNKTLDVTTTKNYAKVNSFNPYFTDEINRENHEAISSLINKDKYYEQALSDENPVDVMNGEQYRHSIEFIMFADFANDYNNSKSDPENLKSLHSKVDPTSIWFTNEGVYSPITAGAVSILDDKDRYVAFNSPKAFPISVENDEVKISFSNVSQVEEKTYDYLYNELYSVVEHLSIWSENQSLDKNFDLGKNKQNLFSSYGSPNGLHFDIDGDIASFDINVKDQQGNVISLRNYSLVYSSVDDIYNNAILQTKDSDDLLTTVPYDLSMEFDHEIAVAYLDNTNVRLEEVIKNMNSNNKMTGFHWSISGKHANDLTIVASSKQNGEHKFVNNLINFKKERTFEAEKSDK